MLLLLFVSFVWLLVVVGGVVDVVGVDGCDCLCVLVVGDVCVVFGVDVCCVCGDGCCFV